MANARELLNKLIYYEEPANADVTYSHEPNGDLDANKLINGDPCWIQPSAVGYVPKPKKIIITDWSLKYGINLLSHTLKNELYKLLIENGAEVYVWTGKLTRVTDLNDLNERLLEVEPIHRQDVLKQLEQQKIQSDACEIIDYIRKQELQSQLKEMIPYSEEQISLKLSTFRHLDADTFSQLLATLDFSTKASITIDRDAEQEHINATFLSQQPIHGINLDHSATGLIHQNPDHLNQYPAHYYDKVKELDLALLTISDETLKYYLSLFHRLESLNIGLCANLTESVYDAIKQANLKELVLWESKINSQQLVTLLTNNPNINNLDMSESKNLIENIESFPLQSTQITELNVSRCSIHPSFLTKLITCSPLLAKLNLNSFKDFALLDFEHDLTNLTDLNLSYSSITDEQLVKLLKRCPNLRTLRLEGCVNLSGQFANHITLPLLTDLDLTSTKMPLEYIGKLLKCSPSLQRIALCNYKEWKNLNDFLPNNLELANLTFLNLNNSNINDEQLVELLKHCPNLRKLYINQCKNLTGEFAHQIMNNNLTGIGLQATNINYTQLTDLLNHCPAIEDLPLDICKNFKNDMISSSLACPELTNLHQLNLRLTNMAEHQKIHLIKRCPNLQQLDLTEFHCSLNLFFQSLPQLKLNNLQELRIDSADDFELAMILKWCPNLVKLTIYNCEKICGNFVDEVGLRQFNKLRDFNSHDYQAEAVRQKLASICPQLIIPGVVYVPMQASHNLHLNTDTKNHNKPINVRQIFKYKKNGEPYPREYRLTVNKLDLGERIQYAAEARHVIPVDDIDILDHDVKDIYNQQYADNPNIFYGKVDLSLSKNHWTALPSLTENDNILNLHADCDIEISYCEEESLYYVRAKQNIHKTVTVSFTLKTDINPRKLNIPEPQEHAIDLIKSLSFSENGSLEKNSAYDEMMKMPLDQRISNLAEYCTEFGEGDTLGQQNNDIQKLNALLHQRKGSCEHRSWVFQALAQELGISSRRVTNDCHAFVEINYDGHWNRIDLDGYPTKLLIKPMKDDKPQQQNKPPADNAIESPVDIEQINASIDDNLIEAHINADEDTPIEFKLSNRFITWNTTKSNASNFDEFCSDLVSQANELPANQRNVLVMVEDEAQVEAFHANATRYFQKNNQPSFYLHSLGDVSEKSARINPDGSLTKQDSALFDSIKHFKKGALISNWSDYKAAYVGYNAMMDTERKIKNLAIPDSTLVISVITKAQAQKMGEDFYSRCNIKSECITLTSENLYQKLSNISLDTNHFKKAEFYDNAWKAALLGTVGIEGNHFQLEEGTLLQAINAKSPGLVLQNAPWHLVEFRLFMSELIEKRSFFHNGRNISLPENFTFSAITADYQLESKNIEVIKAADNQPFNFVLNSETFSHLFHYRHCENKLLFLKPGWIEEYSTKEKNACHY